MAAQETDPEAATEQICNNLHFGGTSSCTSHRDGHMATFGSVFPVSQSTTVLYGAPCASPLGFQSVDAVSFLQGECAPLWNYSFNGCHHIAPPGTYGSFQALRQNVSCKLPSMEANGKYLHDNATTPEKDHGISVDKVNEDVAMDMSPSRHDVDESGYLSSDSSVYAVNSDDEMVDNVVTNIEEEEDEQSNYLYLNAISVVDDGNKDLGAFEIVAKELKNIRNKLKEYFNYKESLSEAGCSIEKLVQPNYYTTESETGFDTETDREGRVSNTYGAAGSSAEMSDSDLMKIRAPAFIRPPGRPRVQRLKGALDYFGVTKTKKVRSKSRSKNVEEDINETVGKKGKRKMRCRSCKLLGHSSAQCNKKVVDLDSDIPEV